MNEKTERELIDTLQAVLNGIENLKANQDVLIRRVELLESAYDMLAEDHMRAINANAETLSKFGGKAEVLRLMFQSYHKLARDEIEGMNRTLKGFSRLLPGESRRILQENQSRIFGAASMPLHEQLNNDELPV